MKRDDTRPSPQRLDPADPRRDKYRLFFEYANDGLMAIRDTRITDCNERVCEMLGRRREEIVGLHPWDLSPPRQADGRTSKENALDYLSATRTTHSTVMEWIHSKADGELIEVEVSLNRVLLDEGPTVLCILRDLTERRRVRELQTQSELADRALRASEQRLRVALEAAKMGSWEWTRADKRLVWSTEVERILGSEPGGLDGRIDSYLRRIHPEDVNVVRRRAKDAVASHAQGNDHTVEHRVLRPGGAIGWVAVSGRVFRDPDGDPVKIVGTIQDITARKLIEQDLRATKNLLEAAFAQSPSGILIADAPDVSIRMANSAALNMRGGDRSLLTGIEVSRHAECWQTYKADGSLCRPEDLPLSRAVRDGVVSKGEELIIRDNDGNDHWISVNAAPILDADGRVTAGIVVFHDITERKKAERALERRLDFEAMLAKISSDFIGVPATQVDREIDACLGLLGKYGGVERVAIGELKEDASLLSLRHEWAAPGTPPMMKRFQDFSIDSMSWTREQWLDGKTVVITRVSDLPEEAGTERELLQQIGSKSIVSVPLVIGGKVWGEIAFDSVSSERDWPEDFVMRAKLVGEVLANVLARKGAEEALRESEARFRSVFDQQFQLMAILSPDGRIIDINNLGARVAGRDRGDFIGRLFWEHPGWANLQEWREIIRRQVRQAASMRRSLVTEDAFAAADGSIHYATTAYTAIRDERDEVGHILVQATDITARKQAEAALVESREQLRILAAELAATEDRERHRIATYVHDHIEQALAVLKIRFSELKRNVARADTNRIHSEIDDLLDRTIEEAGTLTFNLSPPVLYELGLGPALEMAGERLCGEHGLTFEFSDDESAKPLEADVAALLFRSTRELLMNVIKHAMADRVSVALSCEESAICILVEDDGKGFDRGDAGDRLWGGGFGLFSIREQLRFIDGELAIDSTPRRGTRARLRAPIRSDAGAAG